MAGETSQMLFSFHTHQVSVSDALFYLMASAVALLWIGMARRVLNIGTITLPSALFERLLRA